MPVVGFWAGQGYMSWKSLNEGHWQIWELVLTIAAIFRKPSSIEFSGKKQHVKWAWGSYDQWDTQKENSCASESYEMGVMRATCVDTGVGIDTIVTTNTITAPDYTHPSTSTLIIIFISCPDLGILSPSAYKYIAHVGTCLLSFSLVISVETPFHLDDLAPKAINGLF